MGHRLLSISLAVSAGFGPACRWRGTREDERLSCAQAVAWQQQRGWQQNGAWQGRSTWRQDRAQQWGTQHRTWAQRGGYGGYYIPQSTFGISFGSRHWFRI